MYVCGPKVLHSHCSCSCCTLCTLAFLFDLIFIICVLVFAVWKSLCTHSSTRNKFLIHSIYFEEKFSQKYRILRNNQLIFCTCLRDFLFKIEQKKWSMLQFCMTYRMSQLFSPSSHRRITKICRLSWDPWLTNSALVYEPKCGGGKLRGLNQCVQLYTRAQIHF
jgi:hypothetical protein